MPDITADFAAALHAKCDARRAEGHLTTTVDDWCRQGFLTAGAASARLRSVLQRGR